LVRGLTALALLAVAECAAMTAIGIVAMSPAHAQRSDDRFPFLSRQRPQRSGGGFFQQLFGPRYAPQNDFDAPSQAPADYSRAPAARKPDPKTEAIAPTTSIVVMGDGMADWLAYGLEDAFGDAPEIAILRKSKVNSGLLRYDARNDLDWWHAARDLLAAEKPNYIVMMLGVADRQNIRERDLANENKKEAEKKIADGKKEADSNDSKNATGDEQKKEVEGEAQPAIAAPEPQQTGRRANGVIEFRSEPWEKVYSRRIDDTIASLKSKGVPVFWVGLPSIRGAKSTADAVYLNDLYRARAEKAGIVYIDVWDGFVDEGGKYTTSGPDFEGQMRRLRAGDGVYFTKYGARKLAHYVEREIRRYMSNRGPIALPSGPMGPVPADGKSAVRPLAGPVVPLTSVSGNAEELLGGSNAAASRVDAIASGVLVKGDAVAAPVGRADDFFWPRGGERPPVAAAAPAAASASASVAPAAKVDPVPVAAPPAVARTEPAVPVEKKSARPPNEPAARTSPAQTPNTAARPKPQQHQPVDPRRSADHRARAEAPRPPQPVRRDNPFSNSPFPWLR
jgi:hypothetical protein